MIDQTVDNNMLMSPWREKYLGESIHDCLMILLVSWMNTCLTNLQMLQSWEGYLTLWMVKSGSKEILADEKVGLNVG